MGKGWAGENSELKEGRSNKVKQCECTVQARFVCRVAYISRPQNCPCFLLVSLSISHFPFQALPP